MAKAPGKFLAGLRRFLGLDRPKYQRPLRPKAYERPRRPKAYLSNPERDRLRRGEDVLEHAMTVALGITRNGSSDRARRVIEEHESISEAIERGDAEAAGLSMRYHLHRARQRVTDGQRDV